MLSVSATRSPMRDPSLRPRLAELYRATRYAVAEMIEEETRQLGMALTMPAEEVATRLLALGDGLMLQHLADPSPVTSRSYSSALEALLRAVLAPAERRQVEMNEEGMDDDKCL